MSDVRIVSEGDYVPAGWTSGKKLTVEEWGQREYDSGLKAGQTNGRGQAAQHVLKLAAAAFAKEEDDLAQRLRRIAKDLEELK